MRKCHQRSIGPFFNKMTKDLQERQERIQDQVEALAHTQGIGIILDIHRGRTQVDDPAACRTLIGEYAHFGHQVVQDLFFDFEGTRQIDLILMCAQVGHLLGPDKTVFGLNFCQGNPQLPP